MKKQRTYQAARVQQVRVEELLPMLAAGCIVALDVAKQKFVVAVATLAGELVKLFRFEHPTETGEFLRVVAGLRGGVALGKLVAAMEPTGTYGDAIRHQLVEAGVPVFMVSPKRTHDSQELFDNVPSLHDPKSAVLIAKLHAMGLSTEWKAPPPTRLRLRALVELRQHEQHSAERCYGRMEGVLSRHWPELGQWMDVREQKSALCLLTKYPSPARVSSDPEGVKSLLRGVSRGRLSSEAVAGVLAGAGATLGVPTTPEEELVIRTLARQALDARERADELEHAMLAMRKDDEVLSRLGSWMGTYTAAVVITMCDPRQYTTARQLEKACGLNLREKSSGEHQGRLTITKRGPGLVRQVLYMLALRMIQESDAVRAWYRRRRGYTEESKQRAVVAVMRKLVRAAFHVAKGNAFDAGKLFDLRRLNLDSSKETPAAASREMSATTTGAATGAATSATTSATGAATSATTTSATTSATTTSAVSQAETHVPSGASAARTTSAASQTETHVPSMETSAARSTSAASQTTSAAAPKTTHTPHKTSVVTQKESAAAPTETSMKAPRKVIARTTPRPIARSKKHARANSAAAAST
jgi:transposase